MFANGRLERTPLPACPRSMPAARRGLLDICLHPELRAEPRRSTCPISGEGRGGRRPRWRAPSWATAALRNVTPIFEALPRTLRAACNLGSRIVFDRAGLMYVTCGDRFQMQRAQDLGDLARQDRAA